jgi:GH25 family lysozyme M1 (1,4-beta-N-acetylmuramidase)
VSYLLGIDIFNGNSDGYDMAKVKAEGISFVIHKASQGYIGGPGGWQDWKFVGAINRAKAAGIPVLGGYHWLLKGQGAKQAQNFYGSMQRVGGPRGMLACVDVERNDWNLSLNPDAQTLREFLAEWDRISGGQPCIIYSADWYWGPYMGEPKDFAGRPLWWAGYYMRNYPVPIGQLINDVTPGYFAAFGGWSKYTIRQWTSNGVVSGQGSDCDIFFGTLDELRALTVPKGFAPPPPPPPPAKPTAVDVKGVQASVHAAVDGAWGSDTDRRCELVRHKGPVRDLQRALGIDSDGVWGPNTQRAYNAAVRGIQAALHIAIDGSWGPATDRAYLTASPMR